MRLSIFGETRVELSLNRLDMGDRLLGIRDVFGVAKSMASIIMREFCKVMRKYLQKKVV